MDDNQFSFKVNNILKCGILILLFKVMLSQNSIFTINEIIDTIFSLLGVLLIFIHIITRKYTIRMMVIYLIVSILSLLNVIILRNFHILITVVTILGIRRENLKEIIKFIYSYELVIFIGIVLLSLINWGIKGSAPMKIYSNAECYHFGFGNPNTFAAFILNFVLMWVYINYDKVSVKSIFIILLIMIVVYFVSRTRTIFVETLLLCPALLIAKNSTSIFKKICSIIVMNSIPCLSVMMYFLCKNYLSGNAFIYFLDELFSSRIRLGSFALNTYGISFFGNRITEFSIDYENVWQLTNFTFDNLYTSLMMYQGLIWTIILSALFILISIKLDSISLLCLIIWIAYGMTEVSGLNCYLFFPLLILVELINEKDVHLEIHDDTKSVQIKNDKNLKVS